MHLHIFLSFILTQTPTLLPLAEYSPENRLWYVMFIVNCYIYAPFGSASSFSKYVLSYILFSGILFILVVAATEPRTIVVC